MDDIGGRALTEIGRGAARPSGTEDVDKLDAESFTGGDCPPHSQNEAQAIIRHPLRHGVPS